MYISCGNSNSSFQMLNFIRNEIGVSIMKYSAFNTFYRSLTQTHQMFARVCLGDTIKKSDEIGKSDQCNNVQKCLSICRLEPLKRAGKISKV